MLKLFLLLHFFISIAFAQACPTCPAGGIWSEWTTSGSCNQSCGACATLTYTRTCLSDSMQNCPCVGATSATKRCNTQACNYPRANGPQKPCCVGTPTIKNNWFHCINSPETTDTPPCCPTGGIWGEWSAWEQNGINSEWSRSRNCLSGGFNCPCVGSTEETKFGCPCPVVKTIPATSTACANLTTKKVYAHRNARYYPSQCRSVMMFERSNLRQEFIRANPELNNDLSSTLGYVDETGKCSILDIRMGYLNYDGQFTPFSFTCNLTTSKFDIYLSNISLYVRGVTHFSQFYWPHE